MADPLEHMKENPDRRSHPRQQVHSIAYIELSEGNGGLITDISEDGLAVQAAMAVVDDRLPQMSFQLSSSKSRIETAARVVWKNESKTVAGVQFLDLPEEARTQIREWISSEGHPDELQKGKATARKEEQPLRKPARREPARLRRDRGSEVVAGNQDQNSISPTDATTVLRGAEISGEDPLPAGRSPGRPPQPNADVSGETAHDVLIHARQSATLARTKLKRYLVNESDRILLHDLIFGEAEELYAKLTEENFPMDVPVTDDEFVKRVHDYEGLAEILVAIISTGCFWGDKQQEFLWAKMLERVANTVGLPGGFSQWFDLRSYPALLLLYAGGIAAVASGKYSTLAALLVTPKFRGEDGDCPLVQKLNAMAVIEDGRLGNLLLGDAQYHAPLSAYLYGLLRQPLQEFIPFDADYDESFDRFEYLLALLWTDANPRSASLGWFLPLGRFAWRPTSLFQREKSVAARIAVEISEQGKEWPPLHAGLFGGSMQRLLSSKKRVDRFVAESQAR